VKGEGPVEPRGAKIHSTNLLTAEMADILLKSCWIRENFPSEVNIGQVEQVAQAIQGSEKRQVAWQL